jgi:hypothetical protein
MTNTDQLEMKTFFESWSVGSRELLAAMLSVGTVWFLSAVWPKSLRGLWSVVVPFTFAYSLYWLPVWLGSDPSQYRAWSLIGIGTYFLSGFSPAACWSSFCESAANRAALRVATSAPLVFLLTNGNRMCADSRVLNVRYRGWSQWVGATLTEDHTH